MILQYIHADQLRDRFELWIPAERICQNTHLAALKGHTRTSYGLIKNVSPIEVIAYSGINRKDVRKDTPIYRMPLTFRKIIYDLSMINMDTPQGTLSSMLSLMEEYGEEHYESRLLLAYLYGGIGDFKMAEKCLLELKKELGEDESIQALLDEIPKDEAKYDGSAYPGDDFDYDIDHKQMPYGRTSRKIGANEPCPCGSGKKYKKCCGR